MYIKYHFLAKHGQKQLTQEEAIRISGENPDYSKQELWELIEGGGQAEWECKVQIMQPSEADPETLGFDPFDVTKVWPRGQFPVCSLYNIVVQHRLIRVDAQLRKDGVEQEPRELPPGCRAGCFLTRIHGTRNRRLTRSASAIPHVLLPRCAVPPYWCQSTSDRKRPPGHLPIHANPLASRPTAPSWLNRCLLSTSTAQ